MTESHMAAIEFKHVHYSDRNNPIIKDITGSVPKGKITTLVGPSGAGKTTLFRLCNGLISPDSGEINIHDRNISHYEPIELRRSIGLALQRAPVIRGSVMKNLALPLTLQGSELMEEPRSGDADETPSAVYRRARMQMLQAERDEVLRLRDEGRADHVVLRTVLASLDLEETMLDRLDDQESRLAESEMLPVDTIEAACEHLRATDSCTAARTPEGCEECLRDGTTLGAPAPLPRVRARRLLRLVRGQARDSPLPRDAAPGDALDRTGRGLALVLRRRGRRLTGRSRAPWEAAGSVESLGGPCARRLVDGRDRSSAVDEREVGRDVAALHVGDDRHAEHPEGVPHGVVLREAGAARGVRAADEDAVRLVEPAGQPHRRAARGRCRRSSTRRCRGSAAVPPARGPRRSPPPHRNGSPAVNPIVSTQPPMSRPDTVAGSPSRPGSMRGHVPGLSRVMALTVGLPA